MRELPPLSALRAFLAACQSDSFSEAAEKLNVTHGVISKQVQVAETWFGATLFERKGSRRVATPYALTLAQELTLALEGVSDVALRHRNVMVSHPLRISVPASFCLYWLMPRIAQFYQQYPDVNLRIDSAVSSEQESTGRYDLVIRRQPDAISQIKPFFCDHSTLLASPGFISCHPVSVPQDVLSEACIETLTRPRSWTKWCEAAGIKHVPRSSVHRFDHFYVTAEAIKAGLGFGIGPVNLLQNSLQKGDIQIVFPDIITDAYCYYALTPVGVQKTVAHRAFESWLFSTGNAAG